MAYPYTKYRADWIDDDASKPADAAAFDHIEAGIFDASDVLIPETVFDAKGDLLLGTAADAYARRAVGADDEVLTAASAQSTGVVWQKIGNAMVAANAAIAYSKLNLAGSIVNADVAAGAAIVQSKLAIDGYSSYVPALTATTTNPTLGSGSTQVGEYFQIGKLVVGRATVVFGTSGVSAGTGTYRISVPVTANGAGPQVGSGNILDNSGNLVRLVGVELATTTTFQMRYDNAALGLVTDALPWIWAANDQLTFFFMYRAA